MDIKVLCITVFCGLILSFGAVKAQVDGVQIGDVVRIWAPPVSYLHMVGEVVEISSDRIRITYSYNKPPWRDVYLSSISEIEVRREVRKTGRGAAVGALTGGLTFGFIFMSASGSCDPDEGICFDIPDGVLFLSGVIVGGLPGALIGAIIGSTIKEEQWRRVKFQVEAISWSETNVKNNTIPAVGFQWQF